MANVTEHPTLRGMVDRLKDSAGDRLLAAVLYGPAAHGDSGGHDGELNLLIVLKDLEPESLARLGEPVSWWLKKHQPMPRMFSPAVISDAADVFPIEFLDISSCHIVLHGDDPFTELEVHTDHLRIQCERELREKLMRLREAYVESRGRTKQLQRLLAESYPTFVALFRGCLHLLHSHVPVHNAEVVEAFCHQAGIEPAPFLELEELRAADRTASDPGPLLARYYGELTRAVAAVDRFESQPQGETS